MRKKKKRTKTRPFEAVCPLPPRIRSAYNNHIKKKGSAMSARRRFALLLLPSVIIFNCAPENPTPDAASPPADNLDRSTFGSFEHRGIMYDINDLMDPQFRSNHDDPYVREFDPTVDFRHYGSGILRSEDWTDLDGPRMWKRVPIPPLQYDPKVRGIFEDVELELLRQIQNADEDLEQSLEPEP